MFRPIIAAVLSLVVPAGGDPVPSIDPEPSCRSAAAHAQPIGDIEVCLRKERKARDQLVAHWAEFGAEDKAVCIPLATAGGTPTYTELLTCLELRRDARILREREDHGAAVLKHPNRVSCGIKSGCTPRS
jgi:hypothetical protein